MDMRITECAETWRESGPARIGVLVCSWHARPALATVRSEQSPLREVHGPEQFVVPENIEAARSAWREEVERLMAEKARKDALAGASVRRAVLALQKENT